MITYKNISFSAKTFYGLRFEPGEVKEVPGYITSPSMVRIFTKSKGKPQQMPLFDEPTQSKRGRKPKSTESEKAEVAEEKEIKIETITPKEETSNGNPS